MFSYISLWEGGTWDEIAWEEFRVQTFNFLVLLLFSAVPEISLEVGSEQLSWNTRCYSAHRGAIGLLIQFMESMIYQDQEEKYVLEFTHKKNSNALERVGFPDNSVAK